MMYASNSITFLLSCAAFATATSALEPWLIHDLSTFSPPDRPGSTLSSIVNVTISDPNELTTVVAHCGATWTFQEPPYGKVYDCSEVPGAQWAFAMLEPDDGEPSPTTNFKLHFELHKDGQLFVGAENFKVGDNMRGLCSAGGVCSFSLKEENAPFPVKQVLVV
ncbi:hypothetical protein C7999DRAFT_18049 [Corynascus novoguineensis]|uniref:AA1-like domain-containing protein n=1 Tax=Corynascus novoguineensis TaxID=1126955 RepID=A0AAN7HIU6_9PEZI|nr:hypothetical protein C7999DRAFT_18049 [Corynascus novoguineensis]